MVFNIMHLKAQFILGVAGLVALAAFTGCEVDSADTDIYITPDSGVLNKHQSVALTAHGGYRYTWSLGTEEWGTLSHRTGSEVVYTSLYEPSDTPVVQIINVSSVFYSSDSTGGADTNGTTTSHVSTAQAFLTHLASEADPSEADLATE